MRSTSLVPNLVEALPLENEMPGWQTLLSTYGRGTAKLSENPGTILESALRSLHAEASPTRNQNVQVNYGIITRTMAQWYGNTMALP
jgi:hypothetical protein